MNVSCDTSVSPCEVYYYLFWSKCYCFKIRVTQFWWQKIRNWMELVLDKCYFMSLTWKLDFIPCAFSIYLDCTLHTLFIDLFRNCQNTYANTPANQISIKCCVLAIFIWVSHVYIFLFLSLDFWKVVTAVT